MSVEREGGVVAADAVQGAAADHEIASLRHGPETEDPLPQDIGEDLEEIEDHRADLRAGGQVVVEEGAG